MRRPGRPKPLQVKGRNKLVQLPGFTVVNEKDQFHPFMRLKNKMVTGFVTGLLCFSGCSKSPRQAGLSPADALASFQLPEGFKIELVAAEPLVADPVAMEIDEEGRLYVVEMHGYPLDKSGSGAVKLLQDTDGDGKMDKSTVFADRLVLPTGIMRWKKGVLVTDPPQVLYLEDTDGDGKADLRKTVLQGFALANPQHNVNNPLLGIDNWIYLGHEPAATAKIYTGHFSDRGSEVFFPDHPDGPRLPENALGRSVRFRPDDVLLENLSSQTQFGHTFDKWGHRFLVSNAHHIYHEVIAAAYLERNRSLLLPSAVESVSDHGNAADVYPITRHPEHQLLTDLGVFTAACGITAYTGGAFPAVYDSVVFVAEPVGNLVHADILRDRGATFTAARLFERKEFLASTDAWFRPVNMYVGPDGALYVVDYYRQIIEHPEWMSDDMARSGAIYNGKDKGRIYRISASGGPPPSWTRGIAPGSLQTEELVSRLSSPNAWWRKNAQRLLVDRRDRRAIPLLEETAAHAADPLARLHALWTLDGLSALKAGILIGRMQDEAPGVRENALKLSEKFLKSGTDPEKELIGNALLRMSGDGDARVRYQLLCTLGFLTSPQALRVRNRLLFTHLDDKWMQIAALSAIGSEKELLTDQVIRDYGSLPGFTALAERVSAMAGASGDPVMARYLLSRALNSPGDHWPAALLRGLAQGFRKKRPAGGMYAEERTRLLDYARNNPRTDVRHAAIDMLRVLGLPPGQEAGAAITEALLRARDRSAGTDKRVEALHLLALSGVEQHTGTLQQLTDPAEPLPVQSAALTALGTLPGTAVSDFLTEKWQSLTPGLREQAISSFFANDARIEKLLEALERNIIPASALRWHRQVALMANGNEALRNRARKLLAGSPSTGKKTARAYKGISGLAGNQENGRLLFAAHCAVCHQIGGKNGTAYGPDLATIRNRRAESVMTDILFPNLSIADGYDLWNITLKSGESIQGLIGSETPSAVTIRYYGGNETVIARSEISSLTAMGTSVMTGGFEQLIDRQQMADLLAYLRQPPLPD